MISTHQLSSLRKGIQHVLPHSSIPVMLIVCICITALLPQELYAQTQYVIPSAEIPVRRGQGTEYKIEALVSDGTAVEVLERGDSYSLVRLENEKEGWILTRYLSDDPPLSQKVEELTAENEALRLQGQQAAQEFDTQELQSSQKIEELNRTLEQTQITLDTIESEKNAITATYEKLKKDTANVIAVKENLANSVKENKSIKQQLKRLTRENEELKRDERVNWFLAGGGVLLLGIIIGKITNRQRKRKPSLL